MLLFVYGTLRPGFSHPMARFLSQTARHLGVAKARGQLYRLGRYPGLVESTSESDWVLGDLYELPDDGGETLARLDEYEDIESPQPAYFERRITRVTLASGEEVDASIYWFRGPVNKEDRIVSGDWLAASRGR